MPKKGRVFSGARPTGRQHLGNYLGAIQNYVALQDDYDCVYCIVDVHALTTVETTQELKQNTFEMAVDWLAAGIRPEETILFVQSHVPEVMELHTYLSMVTALGKLTDLPTFKEKVAQQPENVNYGLLGYPVLMTADIVLYKSDVVPVGIDQAPHLEFAREIVRSFNYRYNTKCLIEPQVKHTEILKVLGIDGKAKMSKSLNNHIELASTPEETAARVRAAEKEADEVRRILIDELNRSFITPIDREDLFSLSRAIDDVLDYADTTVEEMVLLGVTPNPYLVRMVSLLRDAAEEINRGVQRLADRPSVANEHAVRAKALENRVESVYREAVGALFNGPRDLEHVVEMLKLREIYRHLSNAADRGDEAANIIGDIVVKQM